MDLAATMVIIQMMVMIIAMVAVVVTMLMCEEKIKVITVAANTYPSRQIKAFRVTSGEIN